MATDYIGYATSNETALLKSTEAACVYCLKKFDPKLVNEWCNEKGKERTAMCPLCGIDSVIPNSLVKYSDADLERWHKQGFGNIKSL